MDPATIASAKGSSVARKSRPLGIAASLVAAGLALTACSAQPGAAAVVDGQRISEQSLSESSQALQPFLQTQLAPATMLSSMIQAQVTLEVAANHGFAASAEDAERSEERRVGKEGRDGGARDQRKKKEGEAETQSRHD